MNLIDDLIEVLFDTQNNEFDNKYEKEKFERFKSLSKTKKLVIFGTGYYLKSIEKYFKLNFDIDVHGIYDWLEEVESKDGEFSNCEDYKYQNNLKYNKYRDKIKLISKEDFYKSPKDTMVFINTDMYPSIPRILYNLGFMDIYTIRNLLKNILPIDILEKQKFDEYELNKLNYSFTTPEIANIMTLYNLLEDKKSKDVFLSILKFKLTEDYYYTISVKDEAKLQYIDNEVIHFSDDEVFLDCGGFIGDTIESFLKVTNGRFKHIYSYEPEENNFNRLNAYVSTLSQKDKITTINAGVYYKNKTFYLSGYSSATTCTENVTDRKAEVVSLDESIKHIPTFIKMDIESFEIQALLGASNSIMKHKPKLAIAVYHKFDDLWNIPLLLKQWVPEYKLIMRHYDSTQEETIIYAIPK
ncbi:MAG: FkbM family methyltransferase [Halarcobacter sp.]